MKANWSVILGSFAAAGCASIPPIPLPGNDQSGGIGVFVKVELSGLANYRADAVFFAKRCEANTVCDERLLRSNYAKEGRIYLLNAEPGDYVVVAAVVDTGLFGDHYLNITYFSQSLINSSAVPLSGPGLTYGGSYEVAASLGLCPDNAEPVQLKHAQMIEPGTPKCGFWEPYFYRLSHTNLMFIGGKAYPSGNMPPSHFRETGYTSAQNDGDVAEFFARAKEDLAGAGWKVERK